MKIRTIMTYVSAHKVPLIVLLVYVVIDLLIFRMDFGQAGFPLGDNSLDFYSYLYFIKRFGLSMWYPLTDWGQPFPGFTGPTVLMPLSYLNLTISIRLIEFVSILLSGFLSFMVLKRLSSNTIGAFAGSFYYMIAMETSQFFDGHVPAMISLALFPFFFYLVRATASAPTISNASLTGAMLYLLSSIGDIGILYMILLFTIPAAVILFIVRYTRQTYNIEEFCNIGFGLAIFILLMLTWLIPYALGARPEYTTNITTTVLDFNLTSGTNIVLALTGFIGDNSYIHYGYGQLTYSLVPSNAYWIYLILPISFAIYVYFKKRWKLTLFLGSGFLSAIIATGNSYPVLNVFNGIIYSNVPYFNYIPALFRWNFYLVFVYSVLASLSISDLIKWIGLADNRQEMLRLRLHHVKEISIDKKRLKKGLVTFIILSFVGVSITQNYAVFKEPPTTFQFPEAHVAGFQYISEKPAYGSVLTIPFGSIYSRTPWGVVSQSSIFMSPYFTKRTVIEFQAGTPGSLQLDRFIGDGLTDGYSNNMTKMLAAVNIQYISATKYYNWSQSSNSVYNPAASYYALQNQTGLNEPVFYGQQQSIYELHNYSGNISFESRFYVYFGDNNLIYSVLDEPWFFGASTPLINGSQPGINKSLLIEHSSGIICSPLTFSLLPQSLLETASTYNIPFIIISDYNSIAHSSATKAAVPWESSNGYAISSLGSNVPVKVPIQMSQLRAYGYYSLNVTSRQVLLPFTAAEIQIGPNNLTISNPALTTVFGNIPWTQPGIVNAGINNQGNYVYNGSVKLVNSTEPYLKWQFAPNNITFQYLNFNISNLSDWNGLVFTSNGTNPLTFLMQGIYPDGYHFSVMSYQIPNPSINQSNFYFFFPQSNQYSHLMNKTMTLERFVVGFHGVTPSFSELSVRNFSFFNYTGKEGFQIFNLGDFNNAGISNISIGTNSLNYIDTLTTIFSKGRYIPPLNEAHISDLRPQPSTTEWSFEFKTSANEWGILLLPQTFNPSWKLNANLPYSQHLVADIGLNGWLVNTSGVFDGKVIYLPQKYLQLSLTLEAVLVPIWSSLAIVVVYRRSTRCRN